MPAGVEISISTNERDLKTSRRYRRALWLAERWRLDAFPALENLAALLWDAGKLQDAERAYRNALSMLDQDHPDFPAVAHDLAEILFELDQVEDGKKHLAMTMKGYSQHFRPDHPDREAATRRIAGLEDAETAPPSPVAFAKPGRPRSMHRRGRGVRRTSLSRKARFDRAGVRRTSVLRRPADGAATVGVATRPRADAGDEGDGADEGADEVSNEVPAADPRLADSAPVLLNSASAPVLRELH